MNKTSKSLSILVVVAIVIILIVCGQITRANDKKEAKRAQNISRTDPYQKLPKDLNIKIVQADATTDHAVSATTTRLKDFHANASASAIAIDADIANRTQDAAVEATDSIKSLTPTAVDIKDAFTGITDVTMNPTIQNLKRSNKLVDNIQDKGIKKDLKQKYNDRLLKLVALRSGKTTDSIAKAVK